VLSEFLSGSDGGGVLKSSSQYSVLSSQYSVLSCQ
jgi:hypothetical protein